MSNQNQGTWLTQEAYDRLQSELDQLITTGRAEIAKRIEIAREEGDLKENGGYHAAKDEQGKMEARIRELTALLRTAIVDQVEFDGTIKPGTKVQAVIAGDEEEFIVGNREIAGDSDLTVYSDASPIGQAILGAKPGEERKYLAPNGKEITVVVKSVSQL